MQRLISRIPLVLSLLVAAMLCTPGVSVSAAPSTSAGVSATVSAASAATLHVDADEPAALAVTEPVALRAPAVASAPRTLHDTGVRAHAAPRGPPHHFA
jgi:hypothetical protein